MGKNAISSYAHDGVSMDTIEAQEYLRSQFHKQLVLSNGWIIKASYQDETGYWNGEMFDLDVDNSEFYRDPSEASSFAHQLKSLLPDMDIVLAPAILSQ